MNGYLAGTLSPIRFGSNGLTPSCIPSRKPRCGLDWHGIVWVGFVVTRKGMCFSAFVSSVVSCSSGPLQRQWAILEHRLR